MAIIKSFEDLLSWQKAQELAVLIYKEFRELKDFGFRDQICRAAVSVSNNIAEGFDRSSRAEFIRFLYYSRGSCSEVKSMLYLAERLSYLDSIQKQNLILLCDEIARLIQGFINVLQANQKKKVE